MAKTKCVVCNSFMGFDIGLGHHPNGNTDHRKTKDGKWACSEKCARDYNLALLNTGGNSGNFSSSSSTREIDYEAIASSRADEAAAKAEKARVDLEKEKHDDEMALKRRQQELEEKKNRQRRADELRAQGKTTQAFFVEHGPTIGIISVVLVFAIGFGIFFLYQGSNKKDASEINLKLERIEDQVKLAIQEGNKEKALDLANQLVHPLHTDDETKKFDAFSGYPKYDEEWTKKREEYKDQIMKLGQTTTIEKNETSKEVTEITLPQKELPVNNESPTKLLEKGIATISAEKSFFYNDADLATKRNGYLLKGQNVEFSSRNGDFIFCKFTNEKGKVTEGWMLSADLTNFKD